MRKITLATGEYYHIFNRGVDKRDIFLDIEDAERFLESVEHFNALEPIGSLYEHRFQLGSSTPKSGELIQLISYCLNPNHFHLLLRQKEERGIQRFMQKVGTGYTNYFNEKYGRSGALFQGRYKAVHVQSNEQLLHTSVYVNLNFETVAKGPLPPISSWGEYISDTRHPMCYKEIILGQFKNPREYEKFARSSFQDIRERKRGEKELAALFGS